MVRKPRKKRAPKPPVDNDIPEVKRFDAPPKPKEVHVQPEPNEVPAELTAASPDTTITTEQLLAVGADPTSPYILCRDGAGRLVVVQGDRWYL